MKWVLGLGGSNHDFSAALLKNGLPHTLIEDERLSRHRYGDRHWASTPCFPSTQYCLDNAKLDFASLDGIFVSNDIEGHNRFWKDMPHTSVGHHLCHASASYYASPFDNAALLVIDGKGGPIGDVNNGRRCFETISAGVGSSAHIDLKTIQAGEHHISTSTWRYISSNSIGWFYSIVTECIGMGPEGEGKTMALAAFGKPRFKNDLLGFIKYDDECTFEMDPYGGIWSYLVELVLKHKHSFAIKADIAASAQSLLEDVILLIARNLKKKTSQRFLAYGGGVALNGVVNNRLREESGFDNVFVFPASGDNGLSAGAALYGYHHIGKKSINNRSLARSVSFAHCGKTYSDEAVEDAARSFSVSLEKMEVHSEIVDRLVYQLVNNNIVALFQDGSEFGPRALGNRSLIALPTVPNIQRHLNRIKRRETFRPFGSVVLEEDADRYFEISGPSPFMLEIALVRKAYRTQLAGAVHIDGTARLQTVANYQRGLIGSILLELGNRGLPPILLNTSFNLKGQPIVENPFDALTAFVHLDLETLVMGSCWIEKHTTTYT